MTTRLWRGYLLVGLAALSAFLATPARLPRDAIYLLIGLSCVVALATAVRRSAPGRRGPWVLMLVGQALWVVGDALSSWYQDIAHVSTYPSPADACYLAAYPLLAAGLLGVLRTRAGRRDVGALLDSAVLTAGLALLSWVLLARPTLEAAAQSHLAAVVGVAYPVADILLVAVLIRFVTTPGARTPAFRWLLAAVGLLVTADTIYDALSLWTTRDPRSLDALWLASYLAWGAAALHPSMATLSEPGDGAPARFTGRRLAALAAASLVAPGILAVEQAFGLPLDVWAVVLGATVLFSLVVARMGLAIRQIVAVNRERVRLQGDLAYQAAHDALTGLANRAQALREIESALQRAQRSGELVGMLFVDLDGFKAVNDTFGHAAGDRVLTAVAQRLTGLVRGGDIVARLGGDEFVVLLETVADEAAVVHAAERIVATVRDPIGIGAGRHVTVGASVGVGISQDGAVDVNRLLHESDTAAYRAKRAGRGRVEIFDDALRTELADRAEIEDALHVAIAENELLLQYQPITALDSGTVQGYEALVRWDRPGHGRLAPDAFIPIAEMSDLICELGAWVLDRASPAARGLDASGDARAQRRGQCLRTARVRSADRHRRHVGTRAGRARPGPTGPGDHRDRARRRSAGPRAPAPDPVDGRADQHRRLRHRLQLGHQTASAARRHHQDRPVFPRPRTEPVLRAVAPDHPGGAHLRAAGGGRGGRGFRPARPADQPVVRVRPGVLPRRTTARRRGRGPRSQRAHLICAIGISNLGVTRSYAE